MLFQKLSKIDWDDTVFDDDIQREWFKWVSQSLEIKSITIPRCYFSTHDEILGCILHMICDAPNLALTSMIYLVTQTQTGYHSALVTSKSRVAPQGKN